MRFTEKIRSSVSSGDQRHQKQIWTLAQSLSRLLGWGPVTTQRYEQGALQDEAHDSILRQMRDDPLFVLKHWEKNKDRLSEFESRKLERHLCELCSRIGADSLVKAFQKEEVLAFGRNPGACGFRVFDLPRTGEVVLFFATECVTCTRPNWQSFSG